MTNVDSPDGKAFTYYRKDIFIVVCIATFFAFSMTTSQSFLPIVMESKGISPTMTGYAMASTAFFALAFGFLSAPLMSRFGTPLLMLFGITIMCLSHLSFEAVGSSSAAVFFSRILFGVGAGVFYPSSLTFVKGMLHGPSTVTLFGIYTSMIPGANLFGPTLGEWYFLKYGSDGYFFITAVPGVVALVLFLAIWYRNRELKEEYRLTAKFSEVLLRPSSWLPLLCLFLAGSIWGYVISFLPYAAAERGLPGALFIVASTIGLFASRFLVINRIRRFNAAWVSGAAICLMATSLLIMALIDNSTSVAVCGFAFGLSYALSYPFISMWMLDLFDRSVHHIVISVTNTLFNFCMFFAPMFCSISIGVFHMEIGTYQIALSLAGLGLLIGGFLARFLFARMP